MELMDKSLMVGDYLTLMCSRLRQNMSLHVSVLLEKSAATVKFCPFVCVPKDLVFWNSFSRTFSVLDTSRSTFHHTVPKRRSEWCRGEFYSKIKEITFIPDTFRWKCIICINIYWRWFCSFRDTQRNTDICTAI